MLRNFILTSWRRAVYRKTVAKLVRRDHKGRYSRLFLRPAHHNIIIILRLTRKIVFLIPMYSVFHHILFLYYARTVLTLTPVQYVRYSVVNEPAIVAFRPPESERIILSPPPASWLHFLSLLNNFYFFPLRRTVVGGLGTYTALLRALFICRFHFFLDSQCKSFVVTSLIPIYVVLCVTVSMSRRKSHLRSGRRAAKGRAGSVFSGARRNNKITLCYYYVPIFYYIP